MGTAYAGPYAEYNGHYYQLLNTFSSPVWSASTRLDRGPFDLLLALTSLSLLPALLGPWATLRLSVSVLVFTLGLFESAAFLLLLPAFGGAALLAALGLMAHLAAYRLMGFGATELSAAAR